MDYKTAYEEAVSNYDKLQKIFWDVYHALHPRQESHIEYLFRVGSQLEKASTQVSNIEDQFSAFRDDIYHEEFMREQSNGTSD